MRPHVTRPQGLIPACAGKTTPPPPQDRERPAHPRVCGENKCVTTAASLKVGSSPRVRGKLLNGHLMAAFVGLIPACAGKTRLLRHPARRRPAHPRVCGENTSLPVCQLLLPGSSPRVRGKQGRNRCPASLQGLIPACAGKTITKGETHHESAAHPRLCGENCSAQGLAQGSVGSSPRVRGKRVMGVRPLSCEGLIPACAGKTHAGNQR